MRERKTATKKVERRLINGKELLMYGNNVPKAPKLICAVPPTPRMSLYKP